MHSILEEGPHDGDDLLLRRVAVNFKALKGVRITLIRVSQSRISRRYAFVVSIEFQTVRETRLKITKCLAVPSLG